MGIKINLFDQDFQPLKSIKNFFRIVMSIDMIVFEFWKKECRILFSSKNKDKAWSDYFNIIINKKNRVKGGSATAKTNHSKVNFSINISLVIYLWNFFYFIFIQFLTIFLIFNRQKRLLSTNFQNFKLWRLIGNSSKNNFHVSN